MSSPVRVDDGWWVDLVAGYLERIGEEPEDAPSDGAGSGACQIGPDKTWTVINDGVEQVWHAEAARPELWAPIGGLPAAVAAARAAASEPKWLDSSGRWVQLARFGMRQSVAPEDRVRGFAVELTNAHLLPRALLPGVGLAPETLPGVLRVALALSDSRSPARRGLHAGPDTGELTSTHRDADGPVERCVVCRYDLATPESHGAVLLAELREVVQPWVAGPGLVEAVGLLSQIGDPETADRVVRAGVSVAEAVEVLADRPGETGQQREQRLGEWRDQVDTVIQLIWRSNG